jgi:hypothetical protein
MNSSILPYAPVAFTLAHIRPLEWNKHLSIPSFLGMLDRSIHYTLNVDDHIVSYIRLTSDCELITTVCDIYTIPEERNKSHMTYLVSNIINLPEFARTTIILRYENRTCRRIFQFEGFNHVMSADHLLIRMPRRGVTLSVSNKVNEEQSQSGPTSSL